MEAKEKSKLDPVVMVNAVDMVIAETMRRGLKKGKGGHGNMPCPIPKCKGRVSFIVYTFNGHVMAQCSVSGCLSVRT